MTKTNNDIIDHVTAKAEEIKAHVSKAINSIDAALSDAEAKTDKAVKWWESKPFTFVSGVALLALVFWAGTRV